ncbi:MAG: hypothetical protein M1370_04530 [Bacteroidetes bacterium]|nr:hypothetical protein [Bacteroidota bacterium]
MPQAKLISIPGTVALLAALLPLIFAGGALAGDLGGPPAIGSPGTLPPSERTATVAPANRLALALYFPWYDPSVWESGAVPELPAERYWSGDPATIRRQVAEAKRAGLDGFVSSYFGPAGDNPTEANLQKLLDEGARQGLKVAIMLETDSPDFFPDLDSQKAALQKVLNVYASHPAYLRLQGKPLIFIWRPRAIFQGGAPVNRDGAAAVSAWADLIAELDPEGKALWIAEGEYAPYLQVFDGMFPFSIAWSGDPAGQLQRYASRVRAYPGKLWFAIAMPGYNDTTTGRPGAFVVDRQGGAYYRMTLDGAIATDPDGIIVVSYNEWVEGHAIESGAAWGDLYLSITREAVDGWRASLIQSAAQSQAEGEPAPD